jgi:Gpi18-like mannosyltransferase
VTARRGALALFVAAALAALCLAYALRDTRGFVMRTGDGRYEGDITHYIYWTRLVSLGGVQDAYGGTWPETYAVYPPVTLYGYQLIGNAYRVFVDPSFDPARAQDSTWLLRAIKFTAIAWHLLAALAIYYVVRQTKRGTLAGVAGALYLANPAAIYDAAHWAQPDGAHSLFSVLAVGWLSAGFPLRAWSAMALGALAKPQAWSILPLMALASWCQFGVRSLLAGAGVAAAIGTVTLVPFVATGRFGELLGLPGVISSVMPAVTANAHNAWWLLFAYRGTDPLFSSDTARWLGPLSYRVVAATLVGAQLLFTSWLFWTRRATLAEAAALSVLGWFLFTTQAHENHLFFVLPLLALAWPLRPRLLLVFGVLSLTVLLNMALHDLLLLESLGLGWDDYLVRSLRTLDAAANVLCFAAWSIAVALRRPGTQSCLEKQQELAGGAAAGQVPVGRCGLP